MSMKPKKTLFIIDNLGSGGAQRQLINLAMGLVNRGHQVHVFCYSPGDVLAAPLREVGVCIYWYQKRSRYSLDVIAALSRLIRKENFDIVLSYLSTPNFYALVAGRLAKGRKLPIIVSERSCDLPGYPGQVELMVRQAYRFADHVVINSYHQAENFARKYSFTRNHITTIYNGYDLNLFSPPNSEPGNNPSRILCIASVSPHKNGLCLIEALNILHRKYKKPFNVTWIGRRDRVGDRLGYIEEMESKIEKYGLQDYWCWLDQRTDIVQQLQQHDVLVHASYGEGLPNVVCEAMACGRPVIVSNTLDHPRLVKDGINGYLFNWQDPLDLVQKLILFNNLSKGERRQIGQNGRRFAEEYLGLDRFVDQYEMLFQSLLS